MSDEALTRIPSKEAGDPAGAPRPPDLVARIRSRNTGGLRCR